MHLFSAIILHFNKAPILEATYKVFLTNKIAKTPPPIHLFKQKSLVTLPNSFLTNAFLTLLDILIIIAPTPTVYKSSAK
jgi:hypothetical protein